jgi:hypothetical protein
MKVNLRPLVIDLKLYAGDAYAVEFDPVDDADEPADLSDRTWAATWSLRRGSTIQVDLDVDASAAAAGTIVVHFRSEATRQFALSGVWDVQGLDDDDQALTLATGSVSILGDVTPEDEAS